MRNVDYLRKFQEAIACEVTQLRRQSRGTRQTAYDGVHLQEEDGMHRYRFRILEPLKIPDASPIEVIISNQRTRATLLGQYGNTAVILFRDYMGDELSRIHVANDPTLLLSILFQRLGQWGRSAGADLPIEVPGSQSGKRFENKRPDFVRALRPELPLRVFNKLYDAASSSSSCDQLFAGEAKLNSEQQLALRTAVSAQVTFIQGPPGTGKTFTLGRILGALLHRGERVVLASTTNRAVDSAVEALVDLARSTAPVSEELKQLLASGKLVRFRSIDRRQSPRIADVGVAADQLAEKRQAQIRDRLVAARNERGDLQEDLRRFEDLRGVFDSVRRHRRQLQDAAAKIAHARAEAAHLTSEVDALRREQVQAANELRRHEPKIERAECLVKELEHISARLAAIELQQNKSRRHREEERAYSAAVSRTTQALESAVEDERQQVELCERARSAGRIKRALQKLKTPDEYADAVTRARAKRRQAANELGNAKRRHAAAHEALKAAQAYVRRASEVPDLRVYLHPGAAPPSLEDAKTQVDILKRDREDLQRRYRALRRKEGEEEQRLSGHASRMATLQDERSRCARRLDEALASSAYRKAVATVDPAAVDEKINALHAKIADVASRIKALEDQMNIALRHVVKEARLIATTVSMLTTNQILESECFDTLVVDEAGMIPLPQLYYAAATARQRCVIVGDPAQLRAIAVSEEPAVEQWLRRDIYELAGGPSKSPRGMVRLAEQRRMHRTVGELASQHFYENRLRHAAPKAVQRLANRGPFPGKAIAVIDTNDASPWATREPAHDRSRINPYQASVVAALVEACLRAGFTSREIGVIAPFSAQCKLLRETLSEHFEDSGDGIAVSTVHGFQGSERDVIILDLVASPPTAPSPLLHEFRVKKGEEPILVSDAANLLNVSITRARSKLLIVGNLKYFLYKLQPASALAKVIGTLRESADVEHVASRAYVSEAPAPRPRRVRPLSPRARSSVVGDHAKNRSVEYFDADSFYKALDRDIAEAESEVIIYSGFCTPRRVKLLLPVLDAAVARGVRIMAVTSSPADQPGLACREAMELLLDHGVELRSHKFVHEKVVLIDDQVAYVGSLNVLSHRDRRELMVRFTAESIGAGLRSFFGAEIARDFESVSAKDCRTKAGARLTPEQALQELKRFKRRIAALTRTHYGAFLRNAVLDALVAQCPRTSEALSEISDYKRGWSVFGEYEEEILRILVRCEA